MNVFEQLRKEYITNGIHLKDLLPDPMAQFDRWFKEAIEECPVDWVETNAMTLSTTNGQEVSSRTVLLKGCENHRFLFFTNYDSEKGRQLTENPTAALLFYWPWLDRQVRISGRVERTSHEVSEKYFHTRSRGSQIGACISAQSIELASREVLDQQVKDFEAEIGEQEIPLPENWGGFALQPQRFEFWQGRLNRLHDRFQYTYGLADDLELADDLIWQQWPDWSIARLYP
ncbi:MAG: pyridoxamine 5'-phosphate oxidase [Planctomycetaceae bacterium]|nr:pyridoxamine 5'-phosphate oxidase [Planctomycetaceae bacterium]MCP4464599.1 pyridoxamine 5'-phosphate oxidase [Planctomycetaceae bacterium]MDG1807071.1 pyridoxamine 5'-phosphate oxidase [Pirellulaceae bacterium]MDG2104603.1 pyridoxamine 5'-phosphate oxidase [Pirellulaceae bacterium]